MSAAGIVVTVLLAVYFVGLPVIIALDPAHLRDAERERLTNQSATASSRRVTREGNPS